MIALIDCGSSRVGAIQGNLRTLGREFTTIALDVCTNLGEKELESYRAFFLSGGPHLFTDPEQAEALRAKFRFLKFLRQPVFGICLGHQALGLAAGAEIYRGPERRESEQITILREHPIFKGIPNHSSFATDHCEGLTLSPEYDLLARSETYGVEAMIHRQCLRFGVQFHPESSGELGLTLVRNFLDLANG